MMQLLKAISWVTGSLFVLYNTTAVYEYLRVFTPNFISKMREYDADRKYNPSMSYKLYMMINHDSFFIRLLTCYYCFGAWLSLISCAWFSCLAWTPAVYLISIATYLASTVLVKKLEQMEQSDA